MEATCVDQLGVLLSEDSPLFTGFHTSLEPQRDCVASGTSETSTSGAGWRVEPGSSWAQASPHPPEQQEVEVLN